MLLETTLSSGDFDSIYAGQGTGRLNGPWNLDSSCGNIRGSGLFARQEIVSKRTTEDLLYQNERLRYKGHLVVERMLA